MSGNGPNPSPNPLPQGGGAGPRVTIVTVSFRSEAQIGAMIETAGLGDGPDGSLDAVVVTNSGDCASLAARPHVRVIDTGTNAGFGRACNAGAAAATGDIILFCNPDARAPRSTIMAAAELLLAQSAPRDESRPGMGAPPELGALAIYLAAEGDPTQCNPTGRVNEHPELNIGACFLMRRSVFREIGGFDPAFFLWWEDTDLRDRVRASGRRVAFADGVVVEHAGGHSTGGPDPEARAFLTRVWASSRTYYLLKHRGRAACAAWLSGFVGLNLWRSVIGRSTDRVYHYPPTAAAFGVRLLMMACMTPRGLRRFVTFDGAGYPWFPDAAAWSRRRANA